MKIMNYKTVQKLSLGIVCSGLLLSTTACTDEEMQVAVGVIAIGAGAAIIGDAVSDGNRDNGRDHGRRGYYECVGGYRPVCESYSDYYGRIHESCSSVYDSCASRRWVEHYATSKSLASNMVQDVSTVEWAKKFNMSHRAAVKMVGALKEARDGKGQKLLALGMNKQELRVLSKYEIPSDKAIDRLGKNLNQRPQDTKVMLIDLVRQAKLSQ